HRQVLARQRRHERGELGAVAADVGDEAGAVVARPRQHLRQLRAAVVGGRQEAVVGVGHGRHDEEGREGRVGHGLEVHHGRVVHEVRGGGEVDERRARRRLHGRLAGAVGAQAPAALRA
ncbi:hypothetical protein DC007_14670, partial [Enterococcus faecalis]